MFTIWSNLQVALDTAKSANSNPQVLLELSLHANITVKCALAKNRKAPLAALERLSHDDSPKVRKAVASNKSIPSYIACFLINDPSSLVRIALTKNKTVYFDTVRPLCLDKSKSARLALARRIDTPLDSFRILVQDVSTQNEEVLVAVAMNPALPKSVAAEFSDLIPWHTKPTPKTKPTTLRQVPSNHRQKVGLPVEYVLAIKDQNQWSDDVRNAPKQEVRA